MIILNQGQANAQLLAAAQAAVAEIDKDELDTRLHLVGHQFAANVYGTWYEYPNWWIK